MTPERWRQIEAIVQGAWDHDVGQRDRFLAEACGQDHSLRQEVDALLAVDDEAGPMLAQAVQGAAQQFQADDFGLADGERIGPYRVVREIGRGGMGTVYLAERDDQQFEKQVAIKLVTRGMDTADLLRRFRHERQILARLDHPYIARLLDGGSTPDGRPYLVMDYVQGSTINAFCADRRLGTRERIELFRKVCAAVQSAHQNLVVHRDLKPGNILVDADGSPKLLDFGIAKLLGPDEASQFTAGAGGMQMLTPEYASPEQVLGEAITTASDVYALGAVLYELLTGNPAHCITSSSALVRAVCEDEIVPPSVAARQAKHPASSPHELAGDLDDILLTALRKDRHERYASAQQFSDDLQRYLENLPVLARPNTLRYRTLKFVRRNRVPVVAAALVAASLIVGIAFSLYEARRAEHRFQQVRRLANSFLFDIHDQIETLPGATRARESMVRTALEYLNSLAGDSRDDPSLQWELASAYLKIGDLQGYGVRPNLGHGEAALESYRKALAIAQDLSSPGSDPKVRRLLALAHHRIGYLVKNEQIEAALDQYRQAVELLDPLYRDAPGNPQDSPVLIVVYGHRGDLEMALGRAADASGSWLRTLEIARSWTLRDPGDASRAALAVGHRRVSVSLQAVGDLTQAMQHAHEAVAIQEALSAGQPGNVALRRDLMNAYEQLSRVAGYPDRLNLEDRQTARTYNRKVVAIAESLSAADPNNRMALSDLVIAESDECVLMSGEDPARVAAICRKALDAAAKQDTVESEWAFVGPTLGLALAGLGRREEALAAGRRAVESQSARVARAPARSDLRLQFLRIQDEMGQLLRALGDRPGELAIYRRSLALAEETLPSRPSDPLLRRDLANCYDHLGQWYEGKDWRQAREWYRKSFDIWTAWPGSAVSGSLDQAHRDHAAHAVARCDAALREKS